MFAWEKNLFKLICLSLFVFAIPLTSLIVKRAKERNRIFIGAKNDVENEILAEIIAQLIEKKTDLKVERKYGLDGFFCFRALRSGEISLYPECTGTAYSAILKGSETLSNKQMLSFLKDRFLKKYQMIWGEPFGFSNDYVFLTKNRDIKCISDLRNGKFKIAVDPEFSSRKEFHDVIQRYGLEEHLNLMIMDPVLSYRALSRGEVDVSVGFSTEPKVLIYGLTKLEDNLHVLPVYQACPVIKSSLLKKYPEVSQILNELSGKISVDLITKLNYEVENEEKSVYTVVNHYIRSFSETATFMDGHD